MTETANDPTLFDLPADDAALEDLAAEGDDAVPADVAGEVDVPDDEPAFSGVCRGGPYSGRRIVSRFPGGFLLYDKQNKHLWTYNADPARAGEFIAAGDGQATPDTSVESLRPVAEGIEYDVLAFDDGPAVT